MTRSEIYREIKLKMKCRGMSTERSCQRLTSGRPYSVCFDAVSLSSLGRSPLAVTIYASCHRPLHFSVLHSLAWRGSLSNGHTTDHVYNSPRAERLKKRLGNKVRPRLKLEIRSWLKRLKNSDYKVDQRQELV